MNHTIVYTNEKGLNIGIGEWRNKPLIIEQALALYDILKKRFSFVARFEDSLSLRYWDGAQDHRSAVLNQYSIYQMNIFHYEDGTEWLKIWVE